MRYAQHQGEHAECIDPACCTCAGDEVDGIIAMLRVLPKLDVAVIEDILVGVHIVEGLRGQHHAHIVTRVEQGQRLQEEVRICNLRN